MPNAALRGGPVRLAALVVIVAAVAVTAAVGAGDHDNKASTLAGAHGVAAAHTVATPGPPDAARKQQALAADRQATLYDAKQAGSRVSPAHNTWYVGSVGTYLVGRSLLPGTYRSAAPLGGSCKWARLRGLSGASGDVIAAADTARQSVITITTTDKFFQTSGCENWQRLH